METLAAPYDDAAAALEALADRLGAPRRRRGAGGQAAGAAHRRAQRGDDRRRDRRDHARKRDRDGRGGDHRPALFRCLRWRAAHTYLALTGGAIGQGLPCATGAAVACPDRKVIAFQADGSGMYTLQALWTQAREHLNVTTLICNNRRYRILQVELARAGVTEPGRQARSLTSLADPEIDWSQISSGLGVPAVRVEPAEDLMTQLERAMAEPGPI